jgi:L-glyceraldehyde 3-phosphate reductase
VEETMSALDAAVRQGKALYVGISSYTAEQTRAAAKVLRDLGTPCLIHQPLYHMLDRWIEKGLLGVLEKEGIGCIPFSPHAQGLLTDRYLEGIPAGARATKTDRVWLTPKDVEASLGKVLKLNAIALARGQTLAQMAITWILRLPQITSVLIGASSVAQLDANLDSLSQPALTESELADIDSILRP